MVALGTILSFRRAVKARSDVPNHTRERWGAIPAKIQNFFFDPYGAYGELVPTSQSTRGNDGERLEPNAEFFF